MSLCSLHLTHVTFSLGDNISGFILGVLDRMNPSLSSLRNGPADMGTLAVDPRGRVQIHSVYWYWGKGHAGEAPLGFVLMISF